MLTVRDARRGVAYARFLHTLSGLTALGCMVELFVLVDAYIRHRASQDQAGFALGLYLFLSYGIPFAGAVLMWAVACRDAADLALSRGVEPPHAEIPSRPRIADDGLSRVGKLMVQACAVVVLLFTVAYVVEVLPSLSTWHSGHGLFENTDVAVLLFELSYVAVLVTFALFLFATGVELGNRGVAPRITRGTSPGGLGSVLVSWSAVALLLSLLMFLIVDATQAFFNGRRPNAPQGPVLSLVTTLLFHAPSIGALVVMIWGWRSFRTVATVDRRRLLPSMRPS